MSKLSRITIRKATNLDSRLLFDLRNNPEIYASFFNVDGISENEHDEWFEVSLKSTNREIFIIQNDNFSIGMVRLDYFEREKVVEISIHVHPNLQGKGYASEALNCISKTVNDFFPKALYLRAKIKSGNAASIRLFEKAEYKVKYLCLEKNICR